VGVGTVGPFNPTYCHEVIPFKGNLVMRVNGTYSLPAAFGVSATYNNTPGVMDLAVWNAPNSLIAPSLGRNLSACGTCPTCTFTFAVPLIQPGTVYEGRRNQLELAIEQDTEAVAESASQRQRRRLQRAQPKTTWQRSKPRTDRNG
jgi:hypothetical protein